MTQMSMAYYVRECGGSWKKAESHHEHAIRTYIHTYVCPGEEPPSGIVCASHGEHICMVRVTPIDKSLYKLQYSYGEILELYVPAY
jgi:hypothetical protein